MKAHLFLPACAAACAFTVSLLHAGDPPAGNILYEENFEKPAPNLGMKGWFQFSAGTDVTSSAVEEFGSGSEGTVGLVFRAHGADPDGLQSYWLAGLGRTALVVPDGNDPANLQFSAFMKLPLETKHRVVVLRFIQGNSEKPTWSAKHRLDIGPDGEVFTFRIGAGETTGTFQAGQPISLHAIHFSHDRFGFNRDVEFAIDDVVVSEVPAAP
jgi:hypothetical protein